MTHGLHSSLVINVRIYQIAVSIPTVWYFRNLWIPGTLLLDEKKKETPDFPSLKKPTDVGWIQYGTYTLLYSISILVKLPTNT